ncbi:hypothetical protein BN1708_016588 [Verticillium longisporum]|uniref:Uncharacterized protein n=1 Tax=Verticillium longisporum TaxID=100787 RepID=A0A0G4MTR2_VERLO|nr:hypothetical protein BN1708_016588 [Verticillium longisporum]
MTRSSATTPRRSTC